MQVRCVVVVRYVVSRGVMSNLKALVATLLSPWLPLFPFPAVAFDLFVRFVRCFLDLVFGGQKETKTKMSVHGAVSLA